MFDTTLYNVLAVTALLVVIGAVFILVRRNGAKHVPDEPAAITENVKLFTELADLTPGPDLLTTEQDDSHPDPIVQCFVFAHYGRFDQCHLVVQDSLTKQPSNTKLLELNEWLAKNPSLDTWNADWISTARNPIELANLLVCQAKFTDARDLLEEALLNNEGDSAAVRKALELVSTAICNPKKHISTL